MDKERFQLLLHRYFDQLLTTEERTELEQMLLSSARAREEFWAEARWNGFLRLWGETEWGRHEAKIIPMPQDEIETRARTAPSQTPRHKATTSHPKSMRRLWQLAAAAVIVLACVLGYRAWFSQRNFPLPRGIAVLTRISESAWTGSRRSLQQGEALQPGWFRLERGAVQIEFSRGTRMVLEAPAEIKLVSENEAFLRCGKLSAYVPSPAHGFKVVTPGFAVVDHGTEFGCIVGGAGEAEVHVFSGEVSWHSTNTAMPVRELKKNQALLITQNTPQPIAASRASFLSEDELAKLSAARERTRLAEWRTSSQQLREHPSTLLYLDFERVRDHQRTLPNLAANAPAGSDASVIGCDPAEGRWSGKGSLEFKRRDDRLRLTIPGQFPALTFLAWVRVDGLANRQQALAMTDNFNLGETHWYIFRDGALALGVHTDTPEQMHGWRNHHSPTAFKPDNLATWRFVASTCDSKTGVVTHYLDGQIISIFNRGIQVPMRLDTFEIGNWGARRDDPRLVPGAWGRAEDAIRNFQGCIDEFAILATVLPAEKIQRIYREGRPGETIITFASQNFGTP